MIFRNNLIKFIFFAFFFAIFLGCQILKNLDFLSSDQRGIYHTVQEGQTLYFIARDYGIDVNRLRQINGIHDPTKLKVGTRLWIPGAWQVLNVDTSIDKQALTKKQRKRNKKLNKKETPNKNIKAIKDF